MSLTPPPSGASPDPSWASASPRPSYAVQPPPAPGAPLSAASPMRRPSWVAWAALGLSALSFLVATSVGILHTVDRFGPSASSEEWVWDAGLPAWGEVELTPTGATTDRALTDAVTDALVEVLEDGVRVENVLCEALPGPKKDTVATCSALVDEYDSTIVVFFTDDRGRFLATLY